MIIAQTTLYSIFFMLIFSFLIDDFLFRFNHQRTDLFYFSYQFFFGWDTATVSIPLRNSICWLLAGSIAYFLFSL